MNDSSDERLRQALRAALRPMDGAPPRDLWPRVLRRLDERPVRASRLDWALLAATLAYLVVFPETVALLLYHF